jgi:hypothetical protein
MPEISLTKRIKISRIWSLMIQMQNVALPIALKNTVPPVNTQYSYLPERAMGQTPYNAKNAARLRHCAQVVIILLSFHTHMECLSVANVLTNIFHLASPEGMGTVHETTTAHKQKTGPTPSDF